jgi:glycosyltransferase involved in cell wall biosynthesis
VSQRFRILHVLFTSRIAGSERYCVDLANEQAALGHAVHVAGNAGSPLGGLLFGDVTFHGFRTPFLRSLKLRSLIAENAIDICHAHLSPACKSVAKAPETVAKIATLHVGYKARQHARLDGLICVNGSQLTRLNGYAGQARLISNWLPATVEGEASDLRAELDLPAETRLVGAVGRLHPSKGQDVLISAFLRSAPRNATLIILGEGPQRAELTKLTAGDPRIHLLGHRDNVAGFLRNLDLFISPSREETFGLAILEAMQEGLPIIATATEGPAEYLRNYPVTLVPPGCVKDLSAALSTAFQADRVVGAPRIDYDLSPFTRATGVANVLEFYEQVADRLQQRSAQMPRLSGLSLTDASKA